MSTSDLFSVKFERSTDFVVGVPRLSKNNLCSSESPTDFVVEVSKLSTTYLQPICSRPIVTLGLGRPFDLPRIRFYDGDDY